MTIVSKIAGGAGVLSSLYDIHKTAVLYSREEFNKASGDAVVSCSLGAQKADRLSYRDAQRKNWIEQNNFGIFFKEAAARIKGYVKGVSEGVVRHLPELSLGAIAVFVKKSKVIPNLAAVGLALYEVYDFIRHSTGLFQKTDYLKRK